MNNSYVNSIFAGVGGQGVLTVGELIAYAAINCGLNATSYPEYGTEVRGGSASCTVVLSKEPIGSPIIKTPQTLLALSQVSVDNFLPRVASDGYAVINSSLASAPENSPVKIYPVPATELANQADLSRMMNMVAVGAFAQVSGIVTLESLEKALEKVVPARYNHLMPKNIEALQIGYNYAKENF